MPKPTTITMWNNGVQSLITYLGYAGHIANQSTPGATSRPGRIPSYPPILSTTPSTTELAASRTWWEEDYIVSHILTSRLTISILNILPFDDDDDSLAPRTARTIYKSLRKLYSVDDHISSSALYSELCNLHCGSHVLEYVTKWRGGVAQLRAAKFIISFRMVIEQFLDRLPRSVPYEILRFHTMENIDNIPVDNVTAFIKLTDEVLRIDNIYRRTTSTDPTPTRSLDTGESYHDEQSLPESYYMATTLAPDTLSNSRRKPNLTSKNASSPKSPPTPHYLVVDMSFPSHIFNDQSLFTTYTPTRKIHQTSFGTKVAIEGIGDVQVRVVVKGVSISFHFRGCWHVPTSHHHFLSSSALISHGHQIMIAGRTPRIIIPHKDRLIEPRLPKYMPVTRVNGFFVLQFNIPSRDLPISPIPNTVPHPKQSASPIVSLHVSSSPPFAGLSFSPHLPQSYSPHLPPLLHPAYQTPQDHTLLPPVATLTSSSSIVVNGNGCNDVEPSSSPALPTTSTPTPIASCIQDGSTRDLQQVTLGFCITNEELGAAHGQNKNEANFLSTATSVSTTKTIFESLSPRQSPAPDIHPIISRCVGTRANGGASCMGDDTNGGTGANGGASCMGDDTNRGALCVDVDEINGKDIEYSLVSPPSNPPPSAPGSIAKQSITGICPQILALPTTAHRPLFLEFYKAVVRNPAFFVSSRISTFVHKVPTTARRPLFLGFYKAVVQNPGFVVSSRISTFIHEVGISPSPGQAQPHGGAVSDTHTDGSAMFVSGNKNRDTMADMNVCTNADPNGPQYYQTFCSQHIHPFFPHAVASTVQYKFPTMTPARRQKGNLDVPIQVVSNEIDTNTNGIPSCLSISFSFLSKPLRRHSSESSQNITIFWSILFSFIMFFFFLFFFFLLSVPYQ